MPFLQTPPWDGALTLYLLLGPGTGHTCCKFWAKTKTQGFLFKKQHQSHFLSSTVTQSVIMVFFFNLLFSVHIPQMGKYWGTDPHRHSGFCPTTWYRCA